MPLLTPSALFRAAVPAVALAFGSPTSADEPRAFPPSELPAAPAAKIEEVGAEEYEAPAAALERLAKKQSEAGVRPLPVGDSIQLDTKYQKAREEWNARHLLDGYARHGVADPAWDAAARELLAAAEPSFPLTDDLPEDQLAFLAAKCRSVPKECRDPLVLYCKASVSLVQKQYPEAITMLEKALTEYPKTKYPYAVRMFATRRLAGVHRLFRGPEFEKVVELEDREAREAVAAIEDGEYPEDEPRLVYFHFAAFDKQDRAKHLGRILPTLRKAPKLDAWAWHMLAADFHREYGWEVRGDGFANEVRADQFREFHSQLSRARAHYVAAWDSHPEYPEAADGMIAVSMAEPTGPKDNPRFWFDEAVAAKFNYMSPYWRLRWSLRPRWGGSHEAMIAFGKECAATARFDTLVPYLLYDAVWEVATEVEDKKRVWSEPSTREALKKLYEGGVAEEKDKARRNRLMTKFATVMAWGGDRKLATQLLAKLGPDVDAGALAALGTTLEKLKAFMERGDAPPPIDVLHWRKGLASAAASADGAKLAFAERNGKIHFVDGGKTKPTLSFGSIGRLQGGFNLSADGSRLVYDSGRSVVLVDVATGRTIRTFPVQADQVYCVLSPDGASLLTTANEDFSAGPGEMTLWDVASGEKKRRFTGHNQRIVWMDFSPDGASAVSVTAQLNPDNSQTPGEVKLWDVATGKEKKSAQPFEGWCGRVKYSPDGKYVLAAGVVLNHERWLPGAKLLDAETLEVRQTMHCFGGTPRTLHFLPGGKYAAGGDHRGNVLFWNLENGELVKRLRANGSEIHRLWSTPSGKLAAAHNNGAVDVFQMDLSETVVARWYVDFAIMLCSAEVVDLQFSPDGKALAVQAGNNDVLWLELDRKPLRANATCAIHDVVTSMTVSPDGKRIAITGGETVRRIGELQIVDAATGVKTTQPYQGKLSMAAAWNRDQSLFAFGGEDREIVVRNPARLAVGKCIGHTNTVRRLVFSPDGGTLVSSGSDGALRFWRMPAEGDRKIDPNRQFEQIAAIEDVGSNHWKLGFSPDGKLLAYPDRGVVRILDFETRKEKRSFPGVAFAFSPNGKQIATAGGDESQYEVQIWDLESGEKKKKLTGGHQGEIETVVWSPDGSRIFSGGHDWFLRCWDVSTGKPDWTFPWLLKADPSKR